MQYRSETVERPLSYEDYHYIKMDLTLLFKSMATFDYQMIPSDMGLRLKEILTELAQRMCFESIDAYSLYEEENKIPVTAREVLKKVYGYGFPAPDTNENESHPVLIPAGMLVQRRSSSLEYGFEQTVCQ